MDRIARAIIISFTYQIVVKERFSPALHLIALEKERKMGVHGRTNNEKSGSYVVSEPSKAAGCKF